MSGKYQIDGRLIVLKYYANVHDTIKEIKRIIHEYYPAVSQLAYRLKAGTDDKTFENIWNWVRRNVRYIPDKKGHETLQRPHYTAYKRLAGDCDDMSILIASLLIVLGFDFELIVAAYEKGSKYQHIYPVAYDRYGQRFVIDCVPEIPGFEYEAKPIVDKIVINKNQIIMVLEELGMIGNGQSSESEMLEEMLNPVSASDFAGIGDDEEEIIILQGLLGNVIFVNADEDHKKEISGSQIEKNIILKQLIEAREALKKEVKSPTELSELNNHKIDLSLVNAIIEKYNDPQELNAALDEAITKNTLYKNFYKTIKFGLSEEINGLSGSDEDTYYLQVMEDEGLIDDLLEDDDSQMSGLYDGMGEFGKMKKAKAKKFKNLKNKIKKKVGEFKEKHPKLAKVGKSLMKYSPKNLALRTQIGLFLRTNMFGFAEKLALGFATKQQAAKLGYSPAEHNKFIEAKNQFEKKWKFLGGEPSQLKKIVYEGRGGKKAGLKGMGELGIAPAIISAITQALGAVFQLIKNLKLKKQEKEAKEKAAKSAGGDGGASTEAEYSGSEDYQEDNEDYSGEGESPGKTRSVSTNDDDAEETDGNGEETKPVEGKTTDEEGNTVETTIHKKSGIAKIVTTSPEGKKISTVYKDKEGNKIGVISAYIKMYPVWFGVICFLVVVGLIFVIRAIYRKVKGLSGLGAAESVMTAKEINFHKGKRFAYHNFGARLREYMKKNNITNNRQNRKEAGKAIALAEYGTPLSDKHVNAIASFKNKRKRVRQRAKELQNSGMAKPASWSQAWSEEKGGQISGRKKKW